MEFIDQSITSIYLKPGDVYFSTSPARITTVLGSCVSVIMYCKSRKIGSICHAVMPTLKSIKNSGASANDIFKYVDSSIDWMVSEFEKLYVDKKEIEAKLFGGSDMFTDFSKGKNPIFIGKLNIEKALNILNDHKLKLTAWNVGGHEGRKIIFYTTTGEVLSRYVRRTEMDTLNLDE